MTPEPKPADDGDREATDIFCTELCQSLQEDLDCEGFFFQETPELASVGKPAERIEPGA